MRKSFFRFAILSAAVTSLLAACSPDNSHNVASPDDILTQTVIPQEKTPITVLVKNAFSIHAFEKAAEEHFPSIDIIQVSNYTSNMGTAEYNRRLAHDDLTDIVMTWPLDVGEEYWSDCLLDLSSLPVTNRYNVSMLNSIARNGKLYYLPGPAQIRGIVYNKTLFEERGWEVPHDFEGFTKLCQEIEASGIRSIQLGFGNSEVLDTAFIGYGYGDCFSKPADAQWLNDYNEGKGSFGDHFTPALDTFQNLIDLGIWKKEDLNIYYQDREQMLFTRQCAMVEDSVLMARLGDNRTGCTDEFALMPFFNPNEDGDWARLYMVCYIGLNKHLADPENQKKYDLIMELLDYISTPEGQEALAADTGAMFSCLNQTQAPNVPEIKDLLPTLSHGRYAIFPTLENAQDAVRKGLTGMLKGEMTKEDVIQLVDSENKTSHAAEPLPVLGHGTADFTMIETGNFVTDTMRAYLDTDIALFLDNGKDGNGNGKGLNARLYKGDLTAVDIACIMPDLRAGEAGVLQKITMTGADLQKTLEYSVLVDNNIGGWFYYFSGLRMEYAPAAAPGSRIHKIRDEKNRAIDPEKLYTIAIMDESVPKEYIRSVEDTGIRIDELLIDAIKTQGEISPSKDKRFIICQP